MKREKDNSFRTILLAILLAGGLAGILMLKWDSIIRYLAQDVITTERTAAERKVKELELKLAVEQEKAAVPAPPRDKVAEVFGKDEAGESAAQDDAGRCRDLAEKIDKFFVYLDGRDYIKSYRFPDGSKSYCRQLLHRAFASPPQVVRETDSLSTVLKNSAHFARALNKDDLFFARDVLFRENDLFESLLGLLYERMLIEERCPQKDTDFTVPFDGSYEYAGFFLNTLGGNSYLMRRTPQLRILIRYYSLLIVDQANVRSLNRHGLDIRQPLDVLLADMEGVQKLTRKDEYLRVLTELREKYKLQPSGRSAAAPPAPKKAAPTNKKSR